MSARQKSIAFAIFSTALLVFMFGGFAMSCGKVASEEVGFCGDATCSGSEDCTTCQRDCGACPDKCGDLICSATESCSSCPDDCGNCSGAFCDNHVCDPGETCGSCARDCGACTDNCGDGLCTGSESCHSCDADCGVCVELCGNGVDDDFDSKTDEGGCEGGGY